MMTSIAKRQTHTKLLKVEEARAILAQCRGIDEVKQVRDQAEAITKYLRQQKASLELQNDAAEIKLRAERRMGELLHDMEKNRGGGDHRLHDATSAIPTYEELGIEKTAASRWQTIAAAPEKVFEDYITESRKNGEVTSSGALRVARAATREPKPDDPFHPMLAIGDLKEFIREEIADWPADVRRLVPRVLTDLAEELQEELPQ